MRVGVDTGGTFTDFVYVDETGWFIYKVPSTPARPVEAIMRGLRERGLLDQHFTLVHGTTVGTNAFLERKGARVLLLTTEGFEDVLHIGRQHRRRLYDLHYRRPPPLVPDELRIGVRERIGADGSVVIPLTAEELARVQTFVETHKPEAVAVVFLFSFVNPAHERQVGEALAQWGGPVFLSSEVFPQYREYERTVVTVLNAYLSPVISRYLEALSARVPATIRVMASGGGVIPLPRAVREPIQTLLSGPVAGVVGARVLAEKAGYTRIITLDMGGTSTDVSLVDGAITLTQEAELGELPVGIPMVDIHTIGAGGGSIVWVDSGGALRVGPQSAGADPGPIAYGRGGQQLTVTDAYLFLGWIRPAFFLGGRMRLHRAPVERAMQTLARRLGVESPVLAEGIIEVANAGMERALRRVSVERGYDPKDFALFAFGGAGGLHACALAERLGVETVLSPRYAGVVSAMGTVMTDVVYTKTRSLLLREGEVDDATVQATVRALMEEGWAAMEREGISTDRVHVEVFLLMRYVGQSYELMVPYENQVDAAFRAFDAVHTQRYGFARDDRAREIVGVYVRLIVPEAWPDLPTVPDDPSSPKRAHLGMTATTYGGRTVPFHWFDRARLGAGAVIEGPAVLVDETATFLLPPGWTARVDRWGIVHAHRIGISGEGNHGA